MRYAATAVCLALAASGCARTSAAARPSGPPAVPVVVAPAEVRDVPERLEAVATVEPFETVRVTAQAGGQIVAVKFAEGQDVRAGDLLFEIDPRPYRAALGQAEAALARDQAQARRASADAQRADELFAEGIVSKELHDQARAAAEAGEASVAADAAAAQTARLNLDYTKVHAPIYGRTGSVLVHLGNVVKADDANPLVVINRTDPVYASFAIPERRLAEVRAAEARHPLAVEALIAGDEGPAPSGRLSFVDNQVDAQTGTIRLKATFANAAGRLWPGQFVRARLTLGTRAGAVVIPSGAVQSGQQGSYVFVMKADHTVEQRGVVTRLAEEGRVVVEQGVREGETVVVDGQLSLVNGTRVQPKSPAAGDSTGARPPSGAAGPAGAAAER